MPTSLGEERRALRSHDMVTAMMESSVQREWASRPIAERLAVLKRARNIFAECTGDLCEAISPELARNAADTRVAEILPLLEACRFLEREAAAILAPKRLGRKGRPAWLVGVSSEVHRVPMGHVLVIAPANYPLFLPGVQVLQALAAGNSVTWKPGRGGRAVASIFATVLQEAGLPAGLLAVTDESVEAAQQCIAAGVDKVFFTGSAVSGRKLMKQLAETLTPCVAELSGCDAVFVLPSADLSRVVKALAFGMRLNGSATCMAPRRVILVSASEERRGSFFEMLLVEIGRVKGVGLSENVQRELQILIDDAVRSGATLHGGISVEQRPVVLANATPEMLVAQTDIFSPVLAVMEAQDRQEAIALHEACPYALTASIFGDEIEARAVAVTITAGTVTINDLIVPTVDPRVPFGGRKASGFGATRGAEGLREMTAAKTISIRSGESTRHFDETNVMHKELFDGVIAASHRARWRERMEGLRRLIAAARKLGAK